MVGSTFNQSNILASWVLTWSHNNKFSLSRRRTYSNLALEELLDPLRRLDFGLESRTEMFYAQKTVWVGGKIKRPECGVVPPLAGRKKWINPGC